MIKTFKDLTVWQRSHQFVLEIYLITRQFPSEEKFGLISQIRRSASSIPTDIVEGFKRKSQKEFLHFLNLADASLEETKYHLILSRDLQYLSEEKYSILEKSSNEIGRMLCGLQRSVSDRIKS